MKEKRKPVAMHAQSRVCPSKTKSKSARVDLCAFKAHIYRVLSATRTLTLVADALHFLQLVLFLPVTWLSDKICQACMASPLHAEGNAWLLVEADGVSDALHQRHIQLHRRGKTKFRPGFDDRQHQ